MVAREDIPAEVLALRETCRDQYQRRDPIADDRMLWRAQSFRHLVHLMPGERILEIGCGDLRLTRQIVRVSRGENPVTALRFGATQDDNPPAAVTVLPGHRMATEDWPGTGFEHVIAADMLDQRTAAWMLERIMGSLKPGGTAVLWQTNPWNPVLNVRRALNRLSGRADPRLLIDRTRLYELASASGFVGVSAVFSDFVYPPLSARLMWALRNASIILENMPGIRQLAGSILILLQRPPASEGPLRELTDHDELRGRISVVVPCHNEEMNVGPLVHGLTALYGPYLREIILVDDNSRDGTRQMIRSLEKSEPRVRGLYRTPPNGVGLALRDGYAAARGAWLLSMDCDFRMLLPELRDVFDAATAGADVVVGSRFSRHSVLLNYPFAKIVANRGFHLAARAVLGRPIRDLTNNLKLFRREALDRLRLIEPGFACNAETGLQPVALGLRVEEVPISWIDRRHDMGSSSFSLASAGAPYWRVLYRLWRGKVAQAGPYADLFRGARAPVRDEP